MTSYLLELSRHPKCQCVLPIYLSYYIASDDKNPIGEELMNFVSFVYYDSLSYEEAVSDDCLLKAMSEKIRAIKTRNKHELRNHPNGKKLIDIKWVYTIKYKSNEGGYHFKARTKLKIILKYLCILLDLIWLMA